MTPEEEFEGFLAKYTAEMVAAAHASLDALRALVPGALEMVYDNYNALVVGFGASERPSEAVLSLAMMPRWVTLCFLKGATLDDPEGLLRGSGNIVRNVRLSTAAEMERPALRTLIAQAVAASDPPFDPAAPRRMVIRSISAKQRSRRPAR